MSNLDLASFVENLLSSWFGHGETQITPTAIQDAVTDAGYNPKDLQSLDMKQIYQNACDHPGVPADYKASAQNYDGPSGYDTVVRQIQQVSEVHNINQQYFDNHVDNSVNLDDVNVNGALDITNDPVTAGDHGIAAGGNIDGAATGNNDNATGHGDINQASGGSTLVDGDNYGQANSGDGAAQVNQGTTVVEHEGAIIAPVRSLDPGYGQDLGGDRLVSEVAPPPPHPAFSPVNINTGAGTQQVAQTQGNGDQTNFGEGDNTNVSGSNLENSTIGHDGVATLNNDQLDHSQLGVAGGDQSQGYEDNSEHTHVDNTNSPGSTFDTEQGPGDQVVEPEHHVQHPVLHEI